MTAVSTIAEVTEESLVVIGSATGEGGLRESIGEHIDNPGRAERAVLACHCGWNDLAVRWAEMPDSQSALNYETALLRVYFEQHLRMPSTAGLPAKDTVGMVPADAGAAFLIWSGWHALVGHNKENFPVTYGVYLIAAGKPEDPAHRKLPKGTMAPGACQFAKYEHPCRLLLKHVAPPRGSWIWQNKFARGHRKNRSRHHRKEQLI